jgi:peptidoglycan/xylan/chitin deacetylase (PgdA/CDA1 family)
VSLLDEHLWDPSLYVTAEHLRRRLERLESLGCSVLSLDAALRSMRDGTLPSRSVALTFDDGCQDFALRVTPLLREFDVPATVYVTTYYADKRLPVFDPAVRYVLWRGRSACNVDLLPDASIGSVESLSDAGVRDTLAASIRAYAQDRGLSAAEKNALLRRVAQRVKVDFDEIVESGRLQIMTSEQLRALPADLVSVQLHTHRHCTPRTRDEFLLELEDNRRALDRMRGSESEYRHFCYPSGDFAAEHLPWLRDAGVQSATTCTPGLATRDHDPMLLPRFVDSLSVSDSVFDAWVSGLAEWLPRRESGIPAADEARRVP